MADPAHVALWAAKAELAAERRAEAAAAERRAHADQARRSQPYSWGVDTEKALTHLARKHLTTKALESEVSTLNAELANEQAPQLLSLHLEQEIRMQAGELKSEQKEIEFLTNTVRASNEMPKAKFASYVGKVLSAAGYTGTETKEQKLRLETKTLEEEWAELNQKKEDRAREKEAEAVEYADVTQRLKDLENRMAEDSKMTSSRKKEKDEKMKVCGVCVRARVHVGSRDSIQNGV